LVGEIEIFQNVKTGKANPGYCKQKRQKLSRHARNIDLRAQLVNCLYRRLFFATSRSIAAVLIR
jgi:hypothetical protein